MSVHRLEPGYHISKSRIQPNKAEATYVWDGKRVPSTIHNVARDYSPVTPKIRGGLLDRNLRTRSRARIPPREGDLAHAMAASDPEKLMIKADKLSVPLSLYALHIPCLDCHNCLRFVRYLIYALIA